MSRRPASGLTVDTIRGMPARPSSERLRLYAIAIAVGLLAESLLAISLYAGGNPTAWGPMLFYVEAFALGWVFGAGPGMAAAATPTLLLVVLPSLSDRFADDIEGGIAARVSIAAFLALTFAFSAGMTGVLRRRYRRVA